MVDQIDITRTSGCSIAATKLGNMFEEIRKLTDDSKGSVLNPFSDFTNLYFNVGDYSEGNPNYAPICKVIAEY